MSVHKLFYEEVEEEEITIFAIHSSLLNFRMAYFINKNLNTRLKIVKKEIQVKNKEIEYGFTNYEFHEIKLDRYWKLVENKTTSIHTKQVTSGLFEFENYSSHHYLIPEFKKIDFLLKIENSFDSKEAQSYLKKISSIPQVETAYLLPKTTIKSKNNLLF